MKRRSRGKGVSSSREGEPAGPDGPIAGGGPGGRRLRRALGWSAVVVAALVLLLLITFALPVEEWRTGELPSPPLPVGSSAPPARLPERIWIDTDAACGRSRTTDPDDCFALTHLLEVRGSTVEGVSTVFGNGPLERTDETTRRLVERAGKAGLAEVPVHRGASRAGTSGATPARTALRSALEDGPITIVALGPLTNVAAALAGRPELRANVGRIVAVMGRRPGHLFHPAEGRGSGGLLFGHGPVFRDFNYAMDPEAVVRVLRAGIPTTLIPYEVARQVMITQAGLTGLERIPGPLGWVATRSRGWLDYWNDEVGLEGFYPFDLLAALYALDPTAFECAEASAWVGPDEKLWRFWLQDAEALLVGGRHAAAADAVARAPVEYCVSIRREATLPRWLQEVE